MRGEWPQEGFTTFDVQKIIGIKRNRLKEWIDRGFIVPEWQEQTETGMKSFFTIEGLYKLKIFEALLSLGIKRSFAADMVKKNIYNLSIDIAEIKDSVNSAIDRDLERFVEAIGWEGF